MVPSEKYVSENYKLMTKIRAHYGATPVKKIRPVGGPLQFFLGPRMVKISIFDISVSALFAFSRWEADHLTSIFFHPSEGPSKPGVCTKFRVRGPPPSIFLGGLKSKNFPDFHSILDLSRVSGPVPRQLGARWHNLREGASLPRAWCKNRGRGGSGPPKNGPRRGKKSTISAIFTPFRLEWRQWPCSLTPGGPDDTTCVRGHPSRMPGRKFGAGGARGPLKIDLKERKNENFFSIFPKLWRSIARFPGTLGTRFDRHRVGNFLLYRFGGSFWPVCFGRPAGPPEKLWRQAPDQTFCWCGACRRSFSGGRPPAARNRGSPKTPRIDRGDDPLSNGGRIIPLRPVLREIRAI